MRLRQVGNNQTVLSMPKTEVGRAMDVLFSYETPVVVHHPDSGKYYVSTTKFSATTTRHKNSFVGGNDYTLISQEALEAIYLRR
jgi:hypothetical protein